MTKRGRPKKSTYSTLDLITLVLYANQESRKSGAKYDAALLETVRFVKKHRPNTRISVTEVKRILAEYQPSGGKFALHVSRNKPSDSVAIPCFTDPKQTKPTFKPFRVLLTASWGEPIEYERANAVQ